MKKMENNVLFQIEFEDDGEAKEAERDMRNIFWCCYCSIEERSMNVVNHLLKSQLWLYKY